MGMRKNTAGASSWNELIAKYPNLKGDISQNKNDKSPLITP